jgi:transposase-like protein
MIDGYALPRAPRCEKSDILLVYYEYIQEKVIGFSIRDGEKKEYIVEDLRFIRDQMGYRGIIACISEGSLQIASALRIVYPDALHQRCLVHIQRQVKNYISGNPRTKA